MNAVAPSIDFFSAQADAVALRCAPDVLLRRPGALPIRFSAR